MSEAQSQSLQTPPFQFHLISLATAAVAGVATFGTIAVALPASAMFLGWVGYSIGAQTTRDGLANLICFLLGIGFGIGTALVIGLLTPMLGAGATPVAVAAVVVLVLSLRTLAPINNPLAYFLGLTSFFYSGLAPTTATCATLATAGVIGAASAATVAFLQSVIQGTDQAR